MLKTDYIKAFTKAIEEADLENENVARNLENALVMVSARYEDEECVNILSGANFVDYENDDPVWNFRDYEYRLKPEPQYKPFDVESFKPYRDCWFRRDGFNLIFKATNYDDEGVTVAMYKDKLAWYSWVYFLNNFTLDGKPAGVEVTI